MNNWDRIEQALRIIEQEQSDMLFVAPRESSMMCLHFVGDITSDDLTLRQIEELEKLGVILSAKYETLCIPTELLWDNRNERRF